MKYDIEFKYDKMNGVKVTKMLDDDTGEKVDGIFIPFTINSIYKSRKGIIQYLSAYEKSPNAYGETHTIRVNVTKQRQDQLKMLGYNDNVVCGNMKPKQLYGAKTKVRKLDDDL
jgi:hypothetical protein